MSRYVSEMAKSLGFTQTPPTYYKVEVSGEGHVPTTELLQAPGEKYDGTNVLSPLETARFRILDHIAKLRNNSVTSLFIGIWCYNIGYINISNRTVFR
jgi:hypothetical protein